MTDCNCIFCKLANGEIPTNTLYEDKDFRVIFDLAPAAKGHALIIPKQHYKNIYEIDEEVLAKAYILAKKMVKVMTEEYKADGFNVLQNNGEDAGQSVMHFHIHLIPRHKGDKALGLWKPGKSDESELKMMAESIQNSMK